MQSDTVEHKVHIFISSKCGGKYSIVRKALKELLLETAMTEVYAFETEPCSSEPMPNAYLQYMPPSHLCIFLIDNKDGVSDSVLGEYKLANDLKKKIMCIFCDEYEKNPTHFEEEYKLERIGKYCIVHEFSDITEVAYKSVLQDIVDVYKMRQNIPSLDDAQEDYLSKSSVTLVDNSYFDKKLFNGADKTKNEFIKFVTQDIEEEKKVTSDLDDLASNFLKVIIFEKKFDINEFSLLCKKIIDIHNPILKKIVSKRLKAIQQYYEGKIQECIKTLTDILDLYSENSEIANWIINDVSIDLRNVLQITEEKENRFPFVNLGQKYIDKNPELVYFPVLDNFEKKFKTSVINQYFKIFTDSPYTTTFGGQTAVFNDIAMCYFTALLYGSLTHLQITCSRVAEALFALSFEYSDHDLFVNLIKMLIIERREKDIEKLVRIYNQPVDVVNSSDISLIINCIECMPIASHKIKSDLLLFKYFGYFFSENQYNEISQKLIKFALSWIEDKEKDENIGRLILSAFRENLSRIDNESIVEIIIKLLSIEKSGLFMEVCKLSSSINYQNISEKMQNLLLEKSIEIIRTQEKYLEFDQFVYHLIHLRRTATVNMENFDMVIRNETNDSINREFNLEIFEKDHDSSIKNIQYYLKSIDYRNESQGINGTFLYYVPDPYGIITSIIQLNNIYLTWSEIEPIIERMKCTIFAPQQLLQDKCKAILLLVFLKKRYPEFPEWCSIVDSIINNEENVFKGCSRSLIDKDISRILYFDYRMMLFIFNKSYSQHLLQSIIDIHDMENYEIIYSLGDLYSILDGFDYNNADDLVITTLIALSSMLINHKEVDIRYCAIKCLIQLTNSKYSSIILPKLSSVMDNGTTIIKASILGRVGKIVDINNTMKNYIIQKGRVDNNYLVRKIALDCS
jgi:hypothetical protein